MEPGGNVVAANGHSSAARGNDAAANGETIFTNYCAGRRGATARAGFGEGHVPSRRPSVPFLLAASVGERLLKCLDISLMQDLDWSRCWRRSSRFATSRAWIQPSPYAASRGASSDAPVTGI